MIQTRLFPVEKTRNQIANVASVPHRSPFRYPGGKTWLIPRIREWLFGARRPEHLIEPFAGGGIVSLTVAFENLADRVTMIELDSEVASVWQTILGGDGEWLAQSILDFDLTPEAVTSIVAAKGGSIREQALRTIIKNRTYHGGILAPGSGQLKFGENGKGIKSRWYPETLAGRIRALEFVQHRVEFRLADGIQVMRDNAPRPGTVYFIDPPYTAAGKRAGSRLYTHSELNHEELFNVCSTLAGDFLMTYDNADGVLDLARQFNFDTEVIPMKNTHHARMTELLIGPDLDWVR